jgi:hypothetical protein
LLKRTSSQEQVVQKQAELKEDDSREKDNPGPPEDEDGRAVGTLPSAKQKSAPNSKPEEEQSIHPLLGNPVLPRRPDQEEGG